MKMAKASNADIEMALEVSQFIEELVDGYCPKQAMDPDDTDDIEWLDFDDREQLVRVIEALTKIAKKGSIFRVTFGMAVICDERNELLDPDSDVLEIHPKYRSKSEQSEVSAA